LYERGRSSLVRLGQIQVSDADVILAPLRLHRGLRRGTKAGPEGPAFRIALWLVAASAGRLLAKAVAAVDRLVAAWQERNFGVLAAGGANGRVHFAPAAAATAVIAPTAGSAIGPA